MWEWVCAGACVAAGACANVWLCISASCVGALARVCVGVRLLENRFFLGFLISFIFQKFQKFQKFKKFKN